MAKKYSHIKPTVTTGEAAVSYPHIVTTAEDILGGNEALPQKLDSPLAYMQVAREGLNRTNFERLKAYTGLDTATLSSLLSITSRTVQRKHDTDTFRPDISEKMLEIADLYAFGSEILDTREALQQWMASPVLALGNKKPVELLGSSYGRAMIREVLGRTQYGVFS